jgi:hypothetical protein
VVARQLLVRRFVMLKRQQRLVNEGHAPRASEKETPPQEASEWRLPMGP